MTEVVNISHVFWPNGAMCWPDWPTLVRHLTKWSWVDVEEAICYKGYCLLTKSSEEDWWVPDTFNRIVAEPRQIKISLQ